MSLSEPVQIEKTERMGQRGLVIHPGPPVRGWQGWSLITTREGCTGLSSPVGYILKLMEAYRFTSQATKT